MIDFTGPKDIDYVAAYDAVAIKLEAAQDALQAADVTLAETRIARDLANARVLQLTETLRALAALEEVGPVLAKRADAQPPDDQHIL